MTFSDNIVVPMSSINASELQSQSSLELRQQSSLNINSEKDIAFDNRTRFFIESGQYQSNATDTHNYPAQNYVYGPNETGSMANCYNKNVNNDTLIQVQEQYRRSHSDSNILLVSCHQIHYRVPLAFFQNVPSIIFGVLSIANGEGPIRRRSIRETWGNNRRGVLFLVAGSWEDIREEYEQYSDLLWIEEEEVYDGERSVLTLKTLTFVSVVQHVMGNTHSMHSNLRVGEIGSVVGGGYSHCFKTDDDTYIHVENLYRTLYNASQPHTDYWGWCPENKFPPNRKDGKWLVTHKIYPEPMFPRYCQGAGYALSRNFLDCAVGNNHVANTRFMPFEDVAVGMLAERCHITPIRVAKRRMIRLYRTRKKQERKFVKLSLGKVERHRVPGADMVGRILQHRIYDAEDMWENHRTALDPDFVPPKRIEWKRKVALRRQKEKEELVRS